MNVFSIQLEFTAGSLSYGNFFIVADDILAIVRHEELVRLACYETSEITRQSNISKVFKLCSVSKLAKCYYISSVVLDFMCYLYWASKIILGITRKLTISESFST